MTESEIKASHSEISTIESNTILSDQPISVSFSMHYVLLNDIHSSTITSPCDGFLNIIVPTSANPCICVYFFQQQSYVIRGGENIMHYVKKGDILEWKNTNTGSSALAIYLPKATLSDLNFKVDQNIHQFKDGYIAKNNNRITLIVNQILDLIHPDNYLNKLRIQSLIIQLLILQLEGLSGEEEQQQNIVNTNHYNKILTVKKLIEKDLSRSFTISELAKEVGTNEQYLKKHFKQYFGKTVMNYITEVKMEYAKVLIMTSKYRISDVARMTGYKHSTHFTTVFKKYYGFIPNSLRYTFMIVSTQIEKIIFELGGFIYL